MNQLEKYQDDSLQSVNEFSVACDLLSESHYLDAIKHIAGVLKSIVASKRLYALFGTICNGFDLTQQIAFLQTKDEKGVGYIAMPSDPTRCAAFGFRLLLSIDQKDTLNDFLRANFAHIDFWNNFDGIAKSIVPPFKTATLHLLNNPDKINVIVDQMVVYEEEQAPIQSSVEHTQSKSAPLGDNYTTTLRRPNTKVAIEQIFTQMWDASRLAAQSDDGAKNELMARLENLYFAYNDNNASGIDINKNELLRYANRFGLDHFFAELLVQLDGLQAGNG